MLNDRSSGLALIAGSSGMIITMTLHPTGGHVAAGQMVAMIPMLIAVHALALACVPVMFVGACGLSRRGGGLATAAIVLYTFGLLAVMNAAVLDGLVFPSVLRQIAASAGKPQAEGWFMMSHYTFYANQAYMQVFVTASSAAIILWSAASWSSKLLPRGLAVYGCILSAAIIVAQLSGRLTLDKHGAGLVVFGQGAWFILAGSRLLKREEPVTSAAT